MNRVKCIAKWSFVSGVFCFLGACYTEPADTTYIGAATGGAVGAGLGAIVGSQTGSAGGGLVLGAMAGSAAGAAVGNALQAEEETNRAQDEKIRRQEQALSAQTAELQELRGGSTRGDTYNPRTADRRGSLNSKTVETSNFDRVPKIEYPKNNAVAGGGIRESNLVVAHDEPTYLQEPRLTEPSAPKARFSSESDFVNESEQNADTSDAERIASIPQTKECLDAETEFKSANAASESSDKLFHLRRALRLCPNSSAFHSKLGETYLALNRNEDAQYEFQEALRLDPNYEPAKKNLQTLGRNY